MKDNCKITNLMFCKRALSQEEILNTFNNIYPKDMKKGDITKDEKRN